MKTFETTDIDTRTTLTVRVPETRPNVRNKNAGIRNAFYQSTGKKAKTLKQAKAHFGIK